MKMKRTILLCLLSGLSAFGFSPGQHYLLSGQQTHVTLFAPNAFESATVTWLKPEKEEECRAGPTYERWITQIDPWQNPLSDADGTWLMIGRVSE